MMREWKTRARLSGRKRRCGWRRSTEAKQPSDRFLETVVEPSVVPHYHPVSLFYPRPQRVLSAVQKTVHRRLPA